jgi:hypothetical protein
MTSCSLNARATLLFSSITGNFMIYRPGTCRQARAAFVLGSASVSDFYLIRGSWKSSNILFGGQVHYELWPRQIVKLVLFLRSPSDGCHGAGACESVGETSNNWALLYYFGASEISKQ